MSREPSYPKDVAIGSGKDGTSAKKGAAEPVKSEFSSQEGKGDSSRTKQLVTGAAIGIGSAAIVAALLYANRSKKNDKGSS